MSLLPRQALASCARCRAARSFVRFNSSSTAAGRVEDQDVVIVGGGPIGLALAAALGSSSTLEGAKITLVEAGNLSKVREWKEDRVGYFSNRVSSITNTSQGFLDGIGVWDFVDQSRVLSLENMQVWDGLSDARIFFSTSEMQSAIGGSTPPLTCMAHMTENLNLQRAMLRRLQELKQVQLVEQTKVESIEQESKDAGSAGWPLVRLSDGRTLRARLLVGADGFNSPVRSFAGISCFGWSYDTTAIVATLFHPPRSPILGGNTTAFQRFLPSGPIAFLPLSPTSSSLVWSTRPSLANAITTLSKANPAEGQAVLADMVNTAFRLPWASVHYLYDRLLELSKEAEAVAGDEAVMPWSEALREEIAFRESAHNIDDYSAYSALSPLASTDPGVPLESAESVPPLVTSIQDATIASFPLRFNHADAYLGEGKGGRTVLIGDAAHTIHPLAGQGLNLGLGDVQALADCVREAALVGGDIGSHTALQPYARARYLENHKMMSATDHLHNLYALTAPPAVWARSVGLEVINELDALKAAIMMSAGASNATLSDFSPYPPSSTSWLPGGAGGVPASLAATAASGLQNLLQTSRAVGMVGSVVRSFAESVIRRPS